MPTITTAQRDKVNRDPITDPHIVLLKFQEDSRSVSNRAAINNEDITHDSEVYKATDITFVFPDSGSMAPSVKLDMSNLSRVAGIAINRARNRIGCNFKLIDASDPDVALIDSKNMFVLGNASGDGMRINADLVMRAGLDEPVPSQRTNKNDFPGLWFGR